MEKEILKKVFFERTPDKYFKKYDFGLMLVIGGSDFYSGSPAFNAMAAFRSGVGMVRVIAPARAANIIASFSPNLAAYPLDGKWLEKKHIPILIEMTESAKISAPGKVACVIGGGLGRSEETLMSVVEYLKKIDVPLVIDADGIYALAREPNVLRGKKFIITPHAYEFFILTQKKLPDDLEERIEMIKNESENLGGVILLKGQPDIISDGKEVYLNKTGTPYMAVGGTGDTLAGICGALLARGYDPFLSAKVAAYVNGRAGEIASAKFKDGLCATDLIEEIPTVIKEILSSDQ